MAYLVRIEHKPLNKNQQAAFDKLFEGHDKFILSKNNKGVIIKPALFDFLEFDLIANKSLKRKLTYSLIDKKKDKKPEVVVDRGLIKSDNYNHMVRLLRF